MDYFSTTETLFLASLLLLFLVQMAFYWGFFARLAFYKEKKTEENAMDLPPVSVVIAARNEYYRLKENLSLILEQDYPEFEVVVVNHASDDETKDLLKELSGKYKRLKPVNIEEDLNFFKGKKFPLSIGIKSAHYATLLLTDADCRPISNQWIRRMAFSYHWNTGVVLGYGPYQREKGFVNLLVRYDTFLVAMNYLSFALSGIPYMGVGRNLSYKKELFIKNRGFISNYNIASGDDDLFISQVARKKNTVIQIHPESFVYSEPKKSLREWLVQKKRHLTTGKKYKPGIKILLALFSMSQWLYYLVFIVMLLFGIAVFGVLTIIGLRLLTRIIIHRKISKHLHDRQLFVFSLLLEPIYMLLLPFFAIQGLFGKNRQWK